METQGGLYVPAGKERHVFKAPAPRPSLLGTVSASFIREGNSIPYLSVLTHCGVSSLIGIFLLLGSTSLQLHLFPQV